MRFWRRQYFYFILLSFSLLAYAGYHLWISQEPLHYLDELKFLNEIFISSNEQKLVNKSILMQTIAFMIQETDELDPKLIEFVRSLIHRPSNVKERKLNLKDKRRTDFSQAGQSKLIDKVLKSKRNGFFVEAGGFDGEEHSNTVFFELERNWTGILIEPLPSLHSTILSKNRNIFSINACIANRRPVIAKFRIYNVLSGRVDSMNDALAKRIDKASGTKQMKLVYVPCFSLNTILTALGVSHVDYFSLDVEGGELDVLESIKFDKIKIDSFSIEHNGFENTKQKFISLLESKNFTQVEEDWLDIYFKRNF